MPPSPPKASIRAGIPQTNPALFHAMGFSVGDPAALITLPQADGSTETICIIRDVEMERARGNVHADKVACPADYSPAEGLSPDREIATAQSVAELLRQNNITTTETDRSLPLGFAKVLRDAGITVHCDLNAGIMERRQKSEREILLLGDAQAMTERAVQFLCERIARADADKHGVLHHDGHPLTSERLHASVNSFLMENDYGGPSFIIAGGSQGASCHHTGTGELRTGQPVIVDIFPTNRKTHYCGDCTRTVVHGDIPDEISNMHRAVCAAKKDACAAIHPGAFGSDVHRATIDTLTSLGFNGGFPPADAPDSFCTMHHGTGHGIGIEVHEPPLLDPSGIPLVENDVLTVEPGLYRKDLGGVRVEDMVVVTDSGCENLNHLPETLTWK